MAATELVFKALTDPTRRRILGALSLEELSVSELVEILDQPQSTISRHLKVLRDAGLLLDRRSGPTVLHRTCPPLLEPETLLTAEAGTNGDPAARSDRQGATAGLRHRLLGWIRQQPLDPVIQERLERVIHSRPAKGAGFFDTLGARWDQLRIDAFGETFHWEALTWLLPADWRVADVGSGTGYLLPLLSSRFAEVIAVDPSESMLEAARSRPELKGATNVSFRTGSLEHLPIEAGSLDLAIASLVLHHVGEPAAALRELRRCVRKNGRLLLVEQEAHHYAEFHERMGDHWWGFAPQSLADWALEAGFQKVQIQKLTTARPTARRSLECPRLFVLVAR